jgi:DNA-binding transcriptional regulator YhcF (GntR family)
MAPSTHHDPAGKDSIERVRHTLLAAMHLGRLTPGDRIPSVRRLADMTGLNRKTVHRAYARLAEEGLLDVRPGSGTFISEAMDRSPTSIGALVTAAQSCAELADSLGLSPGRFASFLGSYLDREYRRVPVVVTECNREQIGLIELDLARSLGLSDIRTVPLSRVHRSESVRRGCCVVTTDCHHGEVSEITSEARVPVYRVALDSTFPREMIAHARHGRVVMVVSDRTFAPVFSRLLRSISAPEAIVRRIHIVSVHDVRDDDSVVRDAEVVHLSPLIEEGAVATAGARRVLHTRWGVDPQSLDRLRASIALDLSSGRLSRGIDTGS